MEEDLAIINTNTRNEKIKNFLINNKKLLISFLVFIIFLFICFFIFGEFKERNKIKISNQYNLIVAEYSKKNSEITKNALIDLINKKDSTYSPLSLYFIIDNEIIIDQTIINDLFDVIIEEEFVALEEDDRILMEDYVSGDPESYKTEGGDNLVLEHLNDNLATEGVTGIFHITYDLKIEDFTASVALEDNTSIVLESHTPTGIGDILLTANGDRLIREDDVGDDKFFLSETDIMADLIFFIIFLLFAI